MNEKYQMSFTTGGLFYRESVKIAELHAQLSEWNDVRARVLNDNLLQVQTANSTKRISREIISRLKCLAEEEMGLLVKGSRQEQIQILWVSICRKYKFIHEFVINVLREKYLRHNLSLTIDDYNAFFNAKAQWHDELAKLSSSTQVKLRQVVFRIMKEAEIITRDGKIKPGILSPRIVGVLKKHSHADFAFFPINEDQVREWHD